MDITIRKVTLVEPPGGVTHGEEFRASGGIPVQHHAVPALANDGPVAHDDGAVGLVALARGLVAQGAGPRQEPGLGSLVTLDERRQRCAWLRRSTQRAHCRAKGTKSQKRDEPATIMLMSIHGLILMHQGLSAQTCGHG